MAFVGAMIAGWGAAVVGTVIGETITENRHSVIANDTPYRIRVFIDGVDEGIIHHGDDKKFKVTHATPVRIKVIWDGLDESEGVAKVEDYDHRNFIVKMTASEGLRFVRAKKFRVWVPE